MGLFLIRMKRKNPASGQPDIYYRLGHKKDGASSRPVSLGFLDGGEEEAQVLLAQYRLKLKKGVDPLGIMCGSSKVKSGPTGRIPTLAEWWGEGKPWGESRMHAHFQASGLSASSLVICDSARLSILRELGDRRLDEITPAVWDRFIVALQRRKLRSRTIQLYCGHLRTSLKVAESDGILTAVPNFQRPKLTDARPHRFLTPAQTETLLKELKRREEEGSLEPVSRLAILTTVSMMFRKGETLTRRWEHVSWEGSGSIRVDQVELPDGTMWRPKTRGARVVPMTVAVKAALREWWMSQGRPSSGWIFSNTADPRRPIRDFRRALLTTCRAAGLPLLHPHGLRHTAATRLAWNGVDRHTTMALGGWKRSEMLDEVYAHTTPEHMAEAMVRCGVG